MNKHIDWYQKAIMMAVLMGILFIFAGFQSAPDRSGAPIGQASPIRPGEVLQLDQNTTRYTFWFQASQDENLCLHFVSDLQNIWVYQNDILYSSSDGPENGNAEPAETKQLSDAQDGAWEKEASIGRTPGKQFHFVPIPSGNTMITVIAYSRYLDAADAVLSFWAGEQHGMFQEMLLQSLPFALVYFLTFIGGMALLLYWWMIRKDLNHDKSAFYFALLLMTTGSWLIRGSDFVNILFENHITIYSMGYILFLQIPALLFFFSWYYWEIDGNGWIQKGYAAASLINMLVCVGLYLTGMREWKELAFFVHVLLAAAFMTMLYGMFLHWKEHGTDYKFRLVVLPIVLVLGSTVLNYVGFYQNQMSSYKRGGITTLLFSICISISVLYDLSLQLKEGRQNAIYKKLAITDLLTGLYNRNAYETWEKEQQGSLSGLGIVLCDLNHLKYYNDRYGHEIGDKYIVDASKILLKAMENRGTCYRIGGDEFVVVLEKIPAETVEACLKNMEQLQQEYNEMSDLPLMQIACGYAVAEEQDLTVSDVVKRADQLMYQNKMWIKERQKGKKDIDK